MRISVSNIGHLIGHLLAGVAALYALLTLTALAWRWVRSRRAGATALHPVSVLKPLHGEEFQLYEHLRSFCTQDHPQMQIVCGVRDAQDPALRTVERLRREFPRLDLVVTIDPRPHGTNRKVGNLINMLPAARHDWLVIADSDVRVPPGYLRRVTAPLADPRCGLVTCAYRAWPAPGLPSMLGCLFIDDWFIPSVLVAALFGARSFVSGATMALRRQTLARAGGFEALADQLADDFRLGERVRRCGLRIELSAVPVWTGIEEPSFAALRAHLTRWLCTIRSVAARGFAWSFLTFSLPLAALGGSWCGWDGTWDRLFGITVGARLMVHFAGYRGAPGRGGLRLALLPLHELLLPLLWAASLRRRALSWRDRRFELAADGSLRDAGTGREPGAAAAGPVPPAAH